MIILQKAALKLDAKGVKNFKFPTFGAKKQ
jgi:hypothetical protein